GIRDWSVTGVQTCALPIFVRYSRQARSGSVGIGKPHWNVEQRVANLLIRNVKMLIGEEEEDFVFDEWPATRSSQNVAMQLGNLVVGGNILILVEEECSGVEPARAAVCV